MASRVSISQSLFKKFLKEKGELCCKRSGKEAPHRWTIEKRARYNRDHLRYPSEATDEEWTEVASRIPPARRGGCKRTGNIRDVCNGLRYSWSTGCQWRAIPQDFPPRSTLFYSLGRWEAEGRLRRSHAAR